MTTGSSRTRQRIHLLALVPLLVAGVAAGCGGGGHVSNGQLPVSTVVPPQRTFTYAVPSSSMEPTLHCAKPNVGCEAATPDGVVVQEPALNIQRKDIIAFHTPVLAAVRCGAGGVYIKRVIGLPGERWEERNGSVYINGKKLDEPYVPADERDVRTIAPVTIPPSHYFVMGDNRSSSCDSRAWGSLPAVNVIGKAVRIVRLAGSTG